MPKCYNCGIETLEQITATPMRKCEDRQCSNGIEVTKDSLYCRSHQQQFPKKIKDLENKVAKLEQSRGSLATPTQELQALRTENQSLTTSLTLKDREQAELQAQIRALHTQLSERENQQPNQVQIKKLERKLTLVKQKLVEWNELLTK